MPLIDPGANQKALWAGRSAAYDRWADAQASFAEGFNVPLLDAAGVAANDRVLDLAAGAGEPALSAARRVGPGGHVVASDLSPSMLAGAVRRADTQDQRNVSFVVADMVSLPFGPAIFDAVTCRFGLMFVPDVPCALDGVRRLLRPGGRAAFLVWGPMADNTLSAAIMAALDEVVGPAAGDLERLPFRLADPGRLAGLMRDAGFERAEEIPRQSRRTVPAGEPFWAPTMEKCLGQDWYRDEPRQAAINAAIEKHLAPARRGDSYELANHVRIGVGAA
jgi:ubiquinone/menaquinone biosynthesis C-methylase UbiE